MKLKFKLNTLIVYSSRLINAGATLYIMTTSIDPIYVVYGDFDIINKMAQNWTTVKFKKVG